MIWHIPVLLKETLAFWHARPGGIYVDGTLGAAGHTEALLKLDPEATCIVLDQDAQILDMARERLRPFGKRAQFFNSNYVELPEILAALKISAVSGILLDLGVSSLQLDQAQRGFSFRKKGPLDMRMNNQKGETASDLIRRLSVSDLADLIKDYGEEKFAGPIASALKKQMQAGALQDTEACAQTILEVLRSKQFGKKRYTLQDVAPTFQALRIAVNRELDVLEKFLTFVPDLLEMKGHFVCISFHSLEDRMVKQQLARWSKVCICPPQLPVCGCGNTARMKVLTRKTVEASMQEQAENSRSRSAKLRAGEKI